MQGLDRLRFTVTELLSYIFPKPVAPEPVRAHGKISHELIEEKYCKERECETEVLVCIERETRVRKVRYAVCGKIDIVDHERKLVIEIKPRGALRKGEAMTYYRYQLSAYVAMYRVKQHGTFEHGYYGAWLLYDWNNPENFILLRPLWLDMTVLFLFDDVVERILVERENG